MEQATKLLKKIKDLQTMVDTRDSEIAILLEQNRLLKHKLFAPRTEKLHPEVDKLQGRLFELEEEPLEVLETEEEQAESDEDAAQQEPQTSKPKPRKKKQKFPSYLDRKERRIVLSPEELACPCGCNKEVIRLEKSEYLEYIPAQFYVVDVLREVAACKNPLCEESLEGHPGTVTTAPVPPRILPKSNAGPLLLAHILAAKFVDGLPFYRVVKQLERHGVRIPRQTMSRWAIAVADKLRPLYDLLLEKAKASEYMQMDETTLQVLNENGRANQTKSYMWVMYGGPKNKPITFFNYSSSRGAHVAGELLAGYEGIVQTDGYNGYNFLDHKGSLILHAGCLNHARRKFLEVEKAAGKRAKKVSHARRILATIQKLYKLERQADREGLSDDARLALRREKSTPIMQSLEEQLLYLEDKTPPGGLLGKAVNYTLQRMPQLKVFLKHGCVKLDTNQVENAIRPFVCGRKAWLFNGDPKGAEAAAILYSMIETAKGCGLDPYAWLAHTCQHLPAAQTEQEIAAFLPTEALPHPAPESREPETAA